MSKRMKGTIKTVKDKYGFIKSTLPKDVHFNFNKVDNVSFIREGAEVEFDIKETDRGPTAINIKIINAGPIPSEPRIVNVRKGQTSEVFLPVDTREIISRDTIENFSLKFQKFARFVDDKDKTGFEFYKSSKGNLSFDDSRFDFKGIDFISICKEMVNSAEILFTDFNHTEVLDIDRRLAIGLGTESVYETSINLHPVYGFPFIPGQAIKGITRSWIVQEYFDANEGNAIEDKTFCRLFGCPKDLTLELRNDGGELIKENGKVKKKTYKSGLEKEYQGSLVFFDAYPTEVPKLKVDVMNPHYAPYYSSSNDNPKPPADYYNPKPIYFLTVEDTKYQFIIGIRKDDNIKGLDFEEKTELQLLELGKKYLKEALTQKGVGAKTSVGYGYFNQDKPE